MRPASIFSNIQLSNSRVPEDLARQAGNSCRGYWFTTHAVAINMAMTTAIYAGKTCILGTNVYNPVFDS